MCKRYMAPPYHLHGTCHAHHECYLTLPYLYLKV